MKKGSVGVVVAVIIVSIIAIAAVGAGMYFWQKNVKLEAQLETKDSSTPTVSVTATSQTQDSPQKTVENFMNYTLGTLPSANLNYSAARNLLTEDLRAQFTADATFSAQFYKIQDGPSKAKVANTRHLIFYNVEFEIFNRHSPKRKIIDSACGTATGSHYFQKPHYQYVDIDGAKEMPTIAKKKNPGTYCKT